MGGPVAAAASEDAQMQDEVQPESALPLHIMEQMNKTHETLSLA
jgi:hypothetical protein